MVGVAAAAVVVVAASVFNEAAVVSVELLFLLLSSPSALSVFMVGEVVEAGKDWRLEVIHDKNAFAVKESFGKDQSSMQQPLRYMALIR